MKQREGYIFIIDAVIGLLILSIAMLAYLSLSQKTTEQTVSSQNRETATFLAETALTEVKRTDGSAYDQDVLDGRINNLLAQFNASNPANPNYQIVLTPENVRDFGNHRLTSFRITVSWPIRVLGINRMDNVQISGYHTS